MCSTEMSLYVETEPARATAQNCQELLWLISVMSSSGLQLVQACCPPPVCLPVLFFQSTSNFFLILTIPFFLCICGCLHSILFHLIFYH